METPEHPKEEKLEFLKREEVRTMAKDVAKVREKEAFKQRERIAGLKKETPQKPEVVLSQEPSLKKQEGLKQPQPLVVPRRSLGQRQKLFIRLVVLLAVVFVVVNAVAFGFWYFFKREPGPQPQEQEQVQAPPPAPEPLPVAPEPAPPPAPVPVSFFEAPQQELLLGNSRELLPELQALLAEPPPLGFLNIVVKTQLGLLGTQEFLEKSQILIPPALKERLMENTMLFSYVTDNKKRLGMIFELKEAQRIQEVLTSWEQTLEQDTKEFFDVIGRKGSAYTPFFRSSLYQEVPVRFQTFSVIDFGIVYGVLNGKLILTSSFESFQEVVDQLQQTP